jgi:hypothetical protein
LPFFTPNRAWPWRRHQQWKYAAMMQVVQRKSLAIQIRSQVSVFHIGIDGYGFGLRIQRNHLTHFHQRNEMIGAIGDTVEAMAGSQYLHFVVTFDQFLHLLQRFGLIHPVCAVLIIARPVFIFSSAIRFAKVGSIGVASKVEDSLRKVRFFIMIGLFVDSIRDTLFVSSNGTFTKDNNLGFILPKPIFALS